MVKLSMKNIDDASEWVRRARNNLAIAEQGKMQGDILLEDCCFNCQQAVEKALKAVIVALNQICPRTHSIELLIQCLRKNDIVPPRPVLEAVILNDYAVTTRYPGDYEPVTLEEYKNAYSIAQLVVDWSSCLISNMS